MKHTYQRAILFTLFLTVFTSALALAQDYTVHLSQVDTSEYPEITVYVNVSDSSGAPMTHLTQDDFAIAEDSVTVEIVDFAGVTEARPVDIVFVFDTTGSMRDEIDGLKRTAIDFANKLRESNRDFRLGLVSFTDRVERQFNADGSLTADEEEFRDWVGSLGARGGDGEPENSFGALKIAAQMQFRDEAQVIFILISDAPPHRYGDRPDGGVRFDDPDLTVERILTLLQPNAVTVYPVAYNDPDFRQLAAETGGSFYDINRNPDFTRIIDEIGGTIASQYKVTYRSPRPTYDGTRRDIAVTVGTGTGTGDYLEQHLLNIHSNWTIGLALLLPLLLALIAPRFITSRFSGPGQLAPQVYPDRGGYNPPPQPQPPTVAMTKACPQCRAQVRASARFCSRCRHDFTSSQLSACPQCQAPLRSTARFCASCGYRMIE